MRVEFLTPWDPSSFPFFFFFLFSSNMYIVTLVHLLDLHEFYVSLDILHTSKIRKTCVVDHNNIGVSQASVS